MNPLDLATTSSPPPVVNDLLAKRKRGRPRKDEQENARVTPNHDVNLVGKTVSGVVAGSFDAGYILNVKVDDSDTKLRGFVFARGKVVPVTPANDVAPNVKMFTKEEIKNQSDDQSLPPNDEPVKDVVTDLEISEPARALSLMSKESNDEATTRLVEFFPAPEPKTMVTDQENLAQKETEEQQKSPGEARGFDLMAVEPGGSGENVPQGLQLELGNKSILSGDNNNNNGSEMETDPKSSVSNSGLIAKLFEGEDKKVDCAIVEEATPSVQ
ncbi:unnamed protein product [Eruca vesicaria subsp. sativa]|uniref:AT hook motif-containing protein n=1 Tax=Eruca vesicaria subsp. sativa TaxID=29727 RepID=A0ABC8LX07_ERUVS|nr:unnamed protein product [Eruca vesicaria subsp. sativa]